MTDIDFIQEGNEEEVLSLIESFLNRLKSEDWGFYDRTGEFYKGNEKELIILDKSRNRIIKEMIKSFKEYRKQEQPERSLRNQLIDLIKEADKDGGIMKEDIYKKLTYNPEQIDKEIYSLLVDGVIFEPRQNKLRWLGL